MVQCHKSYVVSEFNTKVLHCSGKSRVIHKTFVNIAISDLLLINFCLSKEIKQDIYKVFFSCIGKTFFLLVYLCLVYCKFFLLQEYDVEYIFCS